MANGHQGKVRSEVSSYLARSNYTGYSDRAWYLLADADFGVLGVLMRGDHDFGVALQEPGGGIESKGEG